MVTVAQIAPITVTFTLPERQLAALRERCVPARWP
jgi:hypothetical protein